MKTSLTSVTGAAIALLAGTAAAPAADLGYGPAPRYAARHRVLPAPVRIGTACDESWDAHLLRCGKQIEITPRRDDYLAWNQLTGNDSHQPRPYGQLFSWSR